MRFSPSCECCDELTPECVIDSDDFDRANSTNLGADWSERAGDWSISSNELAISSANALLRNENAHPDGTANHVVNVKVKFDTLGDKAQLVLAYTDDNNYLAVEIEAGNTSNCGALRFFEVSGGTASQLGDDRQLPLIDLNTLYEVQACYKEGASPSGGQSGQLGARVFGSGGVARYFREVDVSAGTQAGLATGDTVSGTINFDDFTFYKHFTATDTTCARCDVVTCTIHGDNFNRPDGTDIGCLWEEVSGDAEIVTKTFFFTPEKRLKINSANALIIGVPENSDSTYTAHVTLREVFMPNNGDTIKIIVGYANSNNYLVGEVERVTADEWYLRLYEVNDGNETLLNSSEVITDALSTDSAPGGTGSVFTVCYSDGKLTGVVHEGNFGGVYGISAEVDVETISVHQYGLRAGVGTRTLGGSFVSIGEYAYRYHNSSERSDCPLCVAGCKFCLDDDVPDSFVVTINGPVDATDPIGEPGSDQCDDVCNYLINSFVADYIGVDAFSGGGGGDQTDTCYWRYEDGSVLILVVVDVNGWSVQIRTKPITGYFGTDICDGLLVYERDIASTEDCTNMANYCLTLASAQEPCNNPAPSSVCLTAGSQ